MGPSFGRTSRSSKYGLTCTFWPRGEADHFFFFFFADRRAGSWFNDGETLLYRRKRATCRGWPAQAQWLSKDASPLNRPPPRSIYEEARELPGRWRNTRGGGGVQASPNPPPRAERVDVCFPLEVGSWRLGRLGDCVGGAMRCRRSSSRCSRLRQTSAGLQVCRPAIHRSRAFVRCVSVGKGVR